MTSPRFNIFNQIHKALRALMFDTAILVQQTDFADSKAAEPVLAQVKLLLSLFDAHADHEDVCILEPSARHNPALIKEFEAGHQTDLLLSSRLEEFAARYNAAQTEPEKRAVGSSVLYALNEFIAFNLMHMNKEEQELNLILWNHYGDDELLQMEHKIQSLIPPDKLFVYFKWMVRGINNQEMIAWLLALKQGASDFLLTGILEECRNSLPGERWKLIKSHLSEGIQISTS